MVRFGLRPAFFAAILVICSVTLSADEPPAYQKLLDDGGQAYRDKDYRTAAGDYLSALTYPEAREFAGTVFYNTACCYSLLHEGEAAFAYIDSALVSGYDNARWLAGDSDFDFLKEKYAQRFAAVLERARQAAANAVERNSPIAVIEYDNYVGSCDLKYHWDALDHPQADSLRNRYGLAEIASGDTEWERILHVLDWVARRWAHSGVNVANEQNALSILAKAAEGQQFRCVEYATVVANCLSALGYPARVVGLQLRGVAYGSGKGHVVAEVWSNDHDKWVVLDGQNNAYWMAEGEVLSAEECRDLFVTGDEDRLTMVTQYPDRDAVQMKTTWVPYFYHLRHSTDNRFFKSDEDITNRRYELLNEDVLPELYFQGNPNSVRYTDDYAEVYPELNRTYISIGHVNSMKPADTLDLLLGHTMPWFDHFELCVNHAEWTPTDDRFTIALEPGRNVIEARAVSRAGVFGRASRVVLQNNIAADTD